MPEAPAARRRPLPAAIALLASALAGCGADPTPPAGSGAAAAATPPPAAAATSSREDLAAARAAALAKLGGAGIHGRLLTHEGEPATGARVLLRPQLPADEDAEAFDLIYFFVDEGDGGARVQAATSVSDVDLGAHADGWHNVLGQG